MSKTNRDFYTLISLLMGLIAFQAIMKEKLLSTSPTQQPQSHFEVPVTDSAYVYTRKPGTAKTTTLTDKKSSKVSAFPKVNLSSLSGQATVGSSKK